MSAARRAEAANGEGARAITGSGGWPEVAAALAVQFCEARRRFGDTLRLLTVQRMPGRAPARWNGGRDPELLEAYVAWLETEGAGPSRLAPSAFGHRPPRRIHSRRRATGPRTGATTAEGGATDRSTCTAPSSSSRSAGSSPSAARFGDASMAGGPAVDEA